jgi:hypothetical protein
MRTLQKPAATTGRASRPACSVAGEGALNLIPVLESYVSFVVLGNHDPLARGTGMRQTAPELERRRAGSSRDFPNSYAPV